MKALFIGGANHFTVNFAAKLVKNGVDVAVLNNEGDFNLGFKYSKYTSEPYYISHVYANFRPDVIVVTAAFDGAGYLDGFEHILSEAAKSEVQRVIFLSSTTVYGICNNLDFLPNENEELKPKTQNSLLFALGEDICRRWQAASDMKITIIRFGGLYGESVHTADFNQLIHGILLGKKMNLSKDSSFSFLHMDDASEAFQQIFENAFSHTYNVCSGDRLGAGELKELITAENPEFEDLAVLSEETYSECYAADNTLLKSEYQWWERHKLRDEAAEVMKGEKALAASPVRTRTKEEGEDSEEGTSFIGDLWRYGETILLFLVVSLLVNIQDSVDLISHIDFIVIYLTIIAIVMTLKQSALSLLLAVGLLVRQQVQSGYDMFSAIINNRTLLLAAQYCVISIGVSYVIQRLKTRNQLLRLEIKEQKMEMQQLEQFSEDNLRSRHFFEDRIIGYDLSLPRIISMTSRLDTLEPERIIPETIEVIAECMGVNDVAAYFIGERGGRMRLSYAKTEGASAMGQSPVLDDYGLMLSVLKEDGIYTNTQLDEKYPSMASGVKIGDRLAFVFVVFHLPFGRMCLDTSNLFHSITTLVSAALRRANRYEELTYEQRYIPGTTVLRYEAFKNLCEARLSNDEISGGIICRIDTKERGFRETSKLMEGLIRENDYLGTDGKEELYVLLAGTTLAGYEVFERRLSGKGLISARLEEAI